MIPHSARALLLRCGPGATLGSWRRLQFCPCSFWSNDTLNGLPCGPFFLPLKVPFGTRACVFYFLMFHAWAGSIPFIAGTQPRFVMELKFLGVPCCPAADAAQS